jgi:hypothetical protein
MHRRASEARLQTGVGRRERTVQASRKTQIERRAGIHGNTRPAASREPLGQVIAESWQVLAIDRDGL